METTMALQARVLRVDLSAGTATPEEVPPDVLRKWVGGTGLGVYYLAREVTPDVTWDDPRNRVIIASGPLGNTRVSGTGTTSAVFKGPMTNLAGATQANGYLGAFMRSQGYDALIIQGQADKLTHLHIDENGVSLRDASHLAGVGTWELEDKLRAEFGLNEKQLSVFGIGPAGENLVKFACFAGDRGHVASHNGVGAVLGAKKLKAISVKRGRTRAFIADPKKLNDLANPLFVDARDYAGGGLYSWGTAGGLSGAARGGWLPIKNYTTCVFPEHEQINGQYIRGHFKWKNNPCWACQMACCKTMEVTEGPYAGFAGEEPEYEGMASMGSQIGVTDAGAAVFLANEADALGFDVNELGWLLGWVMECYERGLLTKEQLDGLEPRFGNHEAAHAIMKKMAFREGCGQWLGEGVMRASKHVGGAAADAAIYAQKGNSPRTHDHRGRWPEMFDTCLSSTGTIEVTFGGVQVERLGLAPMKDRFSPTEIVDQMVNLNGWHQFDDSLGVCRFDFTNARMGVETVNAVTGWNLSLEDALKIGRRISAQLRVWSFLHGLDPSLERPSTRYGSIPQDGPAQGANIMEHWDSMAARFRSLIGYSPDEGLPLPETLRELDLEELIPVVEQIRAERGAAVG
jgi:aldehyde:ferredoxin oxidoreductase